jgi:peptidoglycan LD-endopeptidase LytH
MSSLKNILGLSSDFQFNNTIVAEDFSQEIFHPVIHLPNEYEVFDFSSGYDEQRTLKFPYGIGKYNEHRPTMYDGKQFHYEDKKHQRTVHIGIDIAAPVETTIHAFADGCVFALGNNDLPYDYGPTLITKHHIQNITFYALHGHLSRKTLVKWSVGDTFTQGTILGFVGSKEENGGWNPHLHFQLSRIGPKQFDLPGVVSLVDRQLALYIFPDPRLVLGDLYIDI